MSKITKNICYVYQDQYPWDVRTEKVTETLAEKGFGVHIVCRNRDGLPSREKIHQNIHVYRLPRGLGRISRHILNFPAFFSPVWILSILYIVKKKKINLIIVRDLPLALAAWCAGKMCGIPVIMDMAENYPAMIQDSWTFGKPNLVDFFVRNPTLLRMLEKIVLLLIEGLIVVSEASKQRVKRILKDKSMPIFVVSNFPYLKKMMRIGDKKPLPLLERIRCSNGLSLLYVGGLEESRGLETVLQAISLLVAKGTDFQFVIVGKGKSELLIRSVSQKLGIEENVLLAGWVDHELIPDVIDASDIGIVPHYVTEHTNTTVPNKIFDYMLQGKPVIVTQAKTLVEIVEYSKCGRVYNDRDHEDLARVLYELQNHHVRKKLGDRGRSAVLDTYNWEKEKEVLLRAVNMFIERGKRNCRNEHTN